MPEIDDLIAEMKPMIEELDRRTSKHKAIEPYLEGSSPLPKAVTQARLTRVYGYLMEPSEAPWGSLIIDSKGDRLELAGLRDPNEANAKKIWEQAWQPNSMDAESKLAHGAALLDGRCYATVWAIDGKPDIALDDVTQMIVRYEDGSRRRRRAALRRWVEGGRVYATLYKPGAVYKFQGPEGSADSATVEEWEKREVRDEDWPLENPLGVVPVVEVAINRRLKPGSFPYARGEFAHCTGLIDRINLLTFLGLVVAFWMGFPLRGVIGEKIRREVLVDDDNNPIIDAATGKEKTKVIPPIDPRPDSFFQLENPTAQLAEYKAADRKNLSIYDELQQLAVITKTPRHYFPMEGGISNIATETVNAYEGAMHAAVTGHKASLGEGWEEVNRLCGMILEAPITDRAEMVWKDHESRSLAERADAASKLKDVLPPMAVAELALNATDEQIGRWSGQGATNPLLEIMAQLRQQGSGVTTG